MDARFDPEFSTRLLSRWIEGRDIWYEQLVKMYLKDLKRVDMEQRLALNRLTAEYLNES